MPNLVTVQRRALELGLRLERFRVRSYWSKSKDQAGIASSQTFTLYTLTRADWTVDKPIACTRHLGDIARMLADPRPNA